MQIKLIISRAGTPTVELTDCIAFSLVRDRYLPYATLRATMIAQQNLYNYPCKAQFYLDGVLLHEGIIEQFSAELRDRTRFVKVVSRSYTAALMHNQPKPGIYPAATLQSLMTMYDLPCVTYETGVTESRYMFVKESASMWEMLNHYNYLLNGGSPYITVPNHVRVRPKSDPREFTVPTARLICKGECTDLSRIISRIDMADASGEYGAYTRTNTEATNRHITRVKQITLDKTYLSDPQKALEVRIKRSMQKMHAEYIEYLGYCGEDIGDRVTCVGFSGAPAGRIELNGSGEGLRTKVFYYHDPFAWQ